MLSEARLPLILRDWHEAHIESVHCFTVCLKAMRFLTE